MTGSDNSYFLKVLVQKRFNWKSFVVKNNPILLAFDKH